MSKLTENYGLIKPEDTDYYNVEDFNGNADIIDEEMKRGSDRTTVLEENLYNPNLLINSNFKVSEIVNQRGESVYNQGGYCIDMWDIRNINVAIDLTDEYVKMKHINNSIDSIKIIRQRIENYKEFSNRTVTVSAEIVVTNGATASIRLIKDSSTYYTKSIVGNGNRQKIVHTVNLGDINSSLGLDIILHTGELTDELTIYNAKLEMGEVATPFVDDDPATKLMKCQRYLYKHEGVITGYVLNSNTLFVNISFPTTMRNVPILLSTIDEIKDGIKTILYAGGILVSPDSISNVNINNGFITSVRLNIELETYGYTTGGTITGAMTVILSAEL